jgi:4-hydroxybenzoate polyprenyltransferase
MSLASNAYKELVFGGHLLALGTASMAATAALVLGKTPSWDLLLMAYLFSYGAYTFNRLSDFAQDEISHPDRTAYLRGRRGAMKSLAVACFALGYVLALLRNLVFFTALLLPLGLAIAYSFGSGRGTRSGGPTRLKDVLLIKNMAISFGWSLVPLLVGLYYLDIPLAVVALAPFIFLRLLVNTIFFDQRDVEADRSFGVRTIPVRFGLSRSTRLVEVIDVASGLYLLAAVAAGALPVFASFLGVFVPYSFAYRAYARSGRHKDSARDLAADGEYLLWGVVTYIGHL